MAGLVEESAVILRKIDQAIPSPRVSVEREFNDPLGDVHSQKEGMNSYKSWRLPRCLDFASQAFG